MQCPYCSFENNPGARFCGSCGERVEPERLQAITGPDYPPMRGMTAPSNPQPGTQYPSMRGMTATAAPEPPGNYPPMRGSAPVVAMEPDATRRSTREMRIVPLPVPRRDSMYAGKKAGLAVALSFIFPGGGQFYNGDTRKGFTVLALAVLASSLTLVIGIPAVGVPLSLGIWIWSMSDANRVANRTKLRDN